MSTSQSATIDIEGMHCQNCAQTVQQALLSTPGIDKASVNLSRNQATITFNPATVSIAAIVQTINRTGFTAAGFTKTS